MNEDPNFEALLREAALAAGGDDPTPAWKVEILSAARGSAVPFAPPRLLLLVWLAAWIAIGLLSWTGQDEDAAARVTTRATTTHASPLFAHHRQMLEQLELP